MTAWLLWITVAMPLALAVLWIIRPLRAAVAQWIAWAPLPALLLAIFGQEASIELPWMLIGCQWGLDATGRVFLGFTAALWMAAGAYGRTYMAPDASRARFDLYFLLTMTGNLGVIIAQDVVSFLMFFTLMSLAAYGLIVHDGRPASVRAGRVYIVLTILGEMALFWGAVLAALQGQTLDFDGIAAAFSITPPGPLVVGLLLVGFGIKLGVMPLHVWLPLAHPAAPTPASAVLSGAIIKAGLLGLLRLLPLGIAALPGWGEVVMAAGIVTALAAALIGATQNNPKTVLAYSSVSQMGLIAVALGAALTAPEAWDVVWTVLMLYAVQHAVAKGSLFLGAGVAAATMERRWQRSVVVIGLAVAGLSLAGLPLTAGYAGKTAIKYAAAAAPHDWAMALEWLLPLTGITTTLVIARFLFLVWPGRQAGHGRLSAGLVVPWSVLSAAVVLIFLNLHAQGLVPSAWIDLSPAHLWEALWPILLAGAFALAVARLMPRRPRVEIPEGDLVVPLEAVMARFRAAYDIATTILAVMYANSIRALSRPLPVTNAMLDRVAHRVESDAVMALLLGVIAVVTLASMLWALV